MKKLFTFIALCLFISSYCQRRLTIITPIQSRDIIDLFITDIINKPVFNDLELLFISNDLTQEQQSILDEYTYIFENIRYFSAPKDQTISALFNQAIKEAQSPYITYLNIDDFRPVQTIQAHLDQLDKHPSIDVVYSDYYSSYDRNVETTKADNWYLINLPEFKPSLLHRDLPGPHATWRKSLHSKIGFFLEEFIFNYQWEFWNRCGAAQVQFKKVYTDASTHYFNYFNQKKIFRNSKDFDISNHEELYIRRTYRSLWQESIEIENSFVIITASYNNKSWYEWNLDSTLNQNYTNYRVIYIDDHSLDNTGQLALEYARSINKLDKIQVIINNEQKGALANIYNAVHSCKPDDIIVLVDGDDSLSNYNVLPFLNSVYKDPNVWFTYGQFEWFPARMPGFASQLPTWVLEQNSVRNYRWVTTHLRSFYAGLFHKIKKDDLMFEGRFCSMAWDLAIIYPMIEMAAFHTKFIDQVLIKYNSETNLNDNQVNADLQNRIDCYIRKQPPYNPIAHFMN